MSSISSSSAACRGAVPRANISASSSLTPPLSDELVLVMRLCTDCSSSAYVRGPPGSAFTGSTFCTETNTSERRETAAGVSPRA